MKILLLFFASIFLFANCEKAQVNLPAVLIYKYKNSNYRNMMQVLYNEDKTKIIGKGQFTDSLLEQSLLLQNGYILDKIGMYFKESNDYGVGSKNISGLLIGISKITKKDFIDNNLPLDTIIKVEIDKDPILEFYYCKNDTLTKNPSLYSQLDQYISNNELVSKLGFIKLK